MTVLADAVVAAIDCGSNSTRLLVSRGGTEDLERRTTITRLAQGVDATGRLAGEAIERVTAVLANYRTILDGHGVDRLRVTATSAARDAVNSEEFFDAAEAALGVRPQVLTGDDEGRHAFAGATQELRDAKVADGPYLVVDIGGGSTEVVLGNDRPTAVRSLDIGCVRLAERFIEHDPASPEELVACLSLTETYLDEVVRLVPDVRLARTLVGVAGTVSAAAAIEIGLPVYDRDRIHHFRLTREAAEDVFRTLATENRSERLGNPGLEEARADVIVAGLCILVQTMRQLDFDECIVSESDILDGLVATLLD